MAVRCGNCKGTHQNADEVKACYRGEQLSIPTHPGMKPKRSSIPAHLRPEHQQPLASARDWSKPTLAGGEVPGGRYCVKLAGDPNQVTLRFHTPNLGKFKGIQLVEYLRGPDNSTEGDWQRFGNIVEGGYRIWNSYLNTDRLMRAVGVMLNIDREAQLDFGESYALQSGNCCKCGRDLTREESIIRGMGPICAAKEAG